MGRPGRPAKKADSGVVTMTVRLPAVTKNWLVDQADAFGLSLTEFIVSLVEKNAR